MAVSTIDSSGLTSPLSATNLGTPSAINLSNATALPKAALPSGSVLANSQQTTTSSSSFTSTSASWQNTAVTFNYTPVSSSSYINVWLDTMVFYIMNSSAASSCWVYPYFRIYESVTGTVVGIAKDSGFRNDGGAYTKELSNPIMLSGQFTNASTAQKTFVLQIYCNDCNPTSGFTININNRTGNGAGSNILIQEVLQ